MATRRFSLGSHLYGQIVYPLMLASLLVGIVATFVAIYFLEDLSDEWVSQLAGVAVDNGANHLVHRADLLSAEAANVISDADLRVAFERADAPAMEVALARIRTPLDVTGIAVLDAAGHAIAVRGFGGLELGERPLGTEGAALIGSPRTMLATVAGIRTMTAIATISTSGGTYSVMISEALGSESLSDYEVERGVTFALYDATPEQVVVIADPETDREYLRDIEERVAVSAPGVAGLLETSGGEDPSVLDVRVGSIDSLLRARPVDFSPDDGGAPDAYLLSVVSKELTQRATSTTRNLVIMWSTVAIVVLVGLGGWIARRVSDPLVELSVQAGRIADGDFSTRVHLKGASEVAELSRSFNEMAASLGEHTEALTKRVLELAAMYEMSRALGTTLDMDELFAGVLDSALRIFDVETGSIALRDIDSGEVTTRVTRSVSGSSPEQSVRDTMAEWVVREGRPLVFNPDSRTSGAAFGVPSGRASLCVPLVSAEGPIGAILVGSTRPDVRFSSDDVRLLSTIANHVAIAIGNIELFSSLQEAYLATVRSLASAVDAKDTYTRGHSDRVATYCMLVADGLGLTHEQKLALEMASYLHDIGKIGISEAILMKPGRLDDVEMAEMRHHPLIGANILRPIAFPWPITPIVRHHHEAYDGSGYPAGLRGEEIPLLARILTVADSFEAMTSDRPYRRGMTLDEAVTELERCAGTQFDPRVVAALAEAIGSGVTVEFAEPITLDDVSPDEVRAVFSALVDGVFSTFRRLGGPRLSANIETEVDERMLARDLPFRISRGRVAFASSGVDDAGLELEQMRIAVKEMDGVISRASGVTLVEHFYVDALSTLSTRMQRLVRELGLRA